MKTKNEPPNTVIAKNMANNNIPGIKLKVLNVNNEILSIKMHEARWLTIVVFNFMYLEVNKVDAITIHEIFIDIHKCKKIENNIVKIVKNIPIKTMEYEHNKVKYLCFLILGKNE